MTAWHCDHDYEPVSRFWRRRFRCIRCGHTTTERTWQTGGCSPDRGCSEAGCCRTTRMNAPSEDRFRGIVASVPYLGDWDEWAPIAYNKIPVIPRMVMAHLYGLHDTRVDNMAWAYCPLCTFFRTHDDAIDDVVGDGS